MPVATLESSVAGNPVTATGADPNKRYSLRYKLVGLDHLEPSHTDALGPNPHFPPDLQPRLRDRAASRLQIRRMAEGLNADALLHDLGVLDRGPMIVGPDMAVESGNGRV